MTTAEYLVQKLLQSTTAVYFAIILFAISLIFRLFYSFVYIIKTLFINKFYDTGRSVNLECGEMIGSMGRLDSGATNGVGLRP